MDFMWKGGETMRGKLRDKYDTKRDRLKREMMGRKPGKRDTHNLRLPDHLDDADDNLLIEEEEMITEEIQID